MDSVAAVSDVVRMQRTLQILSTLQLTSPLFKKSAEVQDGDCFDYIIVGAGSAGSVLATRLTEDNQTKVLLIEAGDDPPIESMFPGLLSFTASSRIDRNYTSEENSKTMQCHRNHKTNLTSAIVLGGGSSINYMFYVRGNPHDYDSWARELKDNSWNWSSVYPYFLKSEKLKDLKVLRSPYTKFHGSSGYIGVTRQPEKGMERYFEAIRERGHKVLLDINGDQRLGFTYQMFTIADGIRQSTAYCYLTSSKSRKNLYILKNTNVVKILFDDNNNAIGVKVNNKNRKTFTLKANKEVILSAGTLNSAKLLMLSGIGPKKHLTELGISVRSDLPVGYNFHDHVCVYLSFKMEQSPPPRPIKDLGKFPFTTITGYVSLNKSQPYPDYQVVNYIIPKDSKSVLPLCSFNFWFNHDICHRINEAIKERNNVFATINLLHPKSRGRVRLRSSNSDDPPIVTTGILDNKIDVDNLEKYIEDYIKILKTRYFKDVNSELIDLVGSNCNGFKPWSKEYWRCYIYCASSTYFHYVGTCAMGAVVDLELRVLGVDRLRVVDASVMPAIVGGNTNAAVIMIAEKAADMIKKSNGRQNNLLKYD